MIYKPFCSTEINFSTKKELKNRLISLKVANILLVMSKSSATRWNMIPFVEELKKQCEDLNGKLTWISKPSANPTQKDLLNSLELIGNSKIELTIAFGGGSAIDLAKGISAFYSYHRNEQLTLKKITRMIKNKEYTCDECMDIIAVPSTSGTGSEVTQWATIWDENSPNKFSIDHPKLKPKLAIVVPELTLTISLKMTLSTGLDAMCQAIEAYWSKRTTPIVQEIAYRAIELVIQNLRSIVDNPHDIVFREKLARASVLAGLAFSQTRTTACHSISYPLTSLFNIPHGFAASITLDAVGEINKGHFENDITLFSLFAEYGGIKNWIDQTCDGVVQMRLSAFGVNEENIPTIVRSAFTGGRMDNNPVDLKEEDVASILRSIL